jgi:hypothetical protein
MCRFAATSSLLASGRIRLLEQHSSVEPDFAAVGANDAIQPPAAAFDQRLSRDFQPEAGEHVVLVAGVTNGVGRSL